MRLSVALICVLLLIAACSGQTQESAFVDSDNAVTQEVVEEDTPEASEEVIQPEEEIDSQLALGEIVFNTPNETGFACDTCHNTSDRRLLGPGMADLEDRVATYSLSEDISTYIRRSIVNPAAFITPADPAFPENIMPRNYADVLTEEEIDAVIVYILSL